MIPPLAVSALLLLQEFATSPHGRQAAANGVRDWILLILAVIVVVVAFVLCARYFLHPGESDPAHIKREILRDTAHAPTTTP